MNGNLNTALIIVSNHIKQQLDENDDLMNSVEKLEKVLLDEVQCDIRREKEISDARTLFQKIRDDGISFASYENDVTKFLGIDES